MKSNSKILMLVLTVCVVGLCVFTIIKLVPNKSKTPEPKQLDATVKISTDIPGIELTNNENESWQDCKLVLNSKWTYELINELDPNKPLNNPFTLFTKSDGTRFNVGDTEPKDVFVVCKSSNQERNNYFVF